MAHTPRLSQPNYFTAEIQGQWLLHGFRWALELVDLNLTERLLLHERRYMYRHNFMRDQIYQVYYITIAQANSLLIQSSSHPIHIFIRIDPQLGQIHVSLSSHCL